MRRPAFKPSLRSQLTENQKALDQMAAMTGKPRVVLYTPTEIKPRAKPGSDGRPLEREVQAEIISYLVKHPMVACLERHNSGTVINAAGQHVSFHHVYQKGCRKVDLDVQRKDGLRMVIEVKRPGWTKPINQREHEQAAYIAMIAANGGIGFFATSVDDVKRRMN